MKKFLLIKNMSQFNKTMDSLTKQNQIQSQHLNPQSPELTNKKVFSYTQIQISDT